MVNYVLIVGVISYPISILVRRLVNHAAGFILNYAVGFSIKPHNFSPVVNLSHQSFFSICLFRASCPFSPKPSTSHDFARGLVVLQGTDEGAVSDGPYTKRKKSNSLPRWQRLRQRHNPQQEVNSIRRRYTNPSA